MLFQSAKGGNMCFCELQIVTATDTNLTLLIFSM